MTNNEYKVEYGTKATEETKETEKETKETEKETKVLVSYKGLVMSYDEFRELKRRELED